MCGTFFVAFLSDFTLDAMEALVNFLLVMSAYHPHNGLMSTTEGECSYTLTHTHTAVKHAVKHEHIHTPRWSHILVVSQTSSSIRKPIMFCTWVYRQYRNLEQCQKSACSLSYQCPICQRERIINVAEKPEKSLVYKLEQMVCVRSFFACMCV